jgi:hypothetical protein
MLNDTYLQHRGNRFPIRLTEQIGSEIARALARNSPLAKPLVIAPAVIRTVLAPTIKDSIAVMHLPNLSIYVNPEAVHYWSLLDQFEQEKECRQNDYRGNDQMQPTERDAVTIRTIHLPEW